MIELNELDHTTHSINEALGISDERQVRLFGKVMEYIYATEATSETIEFIVKDETMTDTEKVLAVWHYGRLCEKI